MGEITPNRTAIRAAMAEFATTRAPRSRSAWLNTAEEERHGDRPPAADRSFASSALTLKKFPTTGARRLRTRGAVQGRRLFSRWDRQAETRNVLGGVLGEEKMAEPEEKPSASGGGEQDPAFRAGGSAGRSGQGQGECWPWPSAATRCRGGHRRYVTRWRGVSVPRPMPERQNRSTNGARDRGQWDQSGKRYKVS